MGYTVFVRMLLKMMIMSYELKRDEDRIVAAHVSVPIRQSHGTTQHNKRFKAVIIRTEFELVQQQEA